jgi:hypothetical protein
MLDKCQKSVPEANFPLESVCLGFSGNDQNVLQIIDLYYTLGQGEKARDLGKRFGDELETTANFFLQFYADADTEFNIAAHFMVELASVYEKHGDKTLADDLRGRLTNMLTAAYGDYSEEEEAAEAAEPEAEASEPAANTSEPAADSAK